MAMVVVRLVHVPYPKLEAGLGYSVHCRESPIHLVTFHYRVESEKGVHWPCFQNPSNAYHFVGELGHLDALVVDYAQYFCETLAQNLMVLFCDLLTEGVDLVVYNGILPQRVSTVCHNK